MKINCFRNLFVLCFAFVLCLNASAADLAMPPKGATLVYVGTFTDTPAKAGGIYLFALGGEGNSSLMPLGLAAETPNPTFLALDAKRHLLFCANEIDNFNGGTNGAVSSFSIEPATGKLTLINQQSSMGIRPCSVVLDKTGKNILVANYNNGSSAVLPVSADGHLGQATSVVQDTGKSVNPDRQAGPHAHCVTISPDNAFVFICDLGIDKVMIYKFDAAHGTLTPNDPPFVSVKPGSGPRHLAFRPDGKFAYLINEMGSTIITYAYDKKAGALKEVQTVSTLPGDYSGVNKAAEIQITPSGKYLFASNRGVENVVAFEIDSRKGTLKELGTQSTEGKTPRHFGMTPSAKQLVICNQDTDSILLCDIAGKGQMKPAGKIVSTPCPVCAVFLPPANER